MTRLDALRSTVIDLERELLALGGDDGLRLLRPEIVQPLGPALRSGEGAGGDDGRRSSQDGEADVVVLRRSGDLSRSGEGNPGCGTGGDDDAQAVRSNVPDDNHVRGGQLGGMVNGDAFGVSRTEGNPNHADDGKFTGFPGGGHGKLRSKFIELHRQHRRDIAELRGMIQELSDHGFRRKGAKGDTDVRRRVVSLDGIAGHAARIDPAETLMASRRFGSARTAKASSAEAIIRHCLRRLGLWLPWKRGEIADGQRLDALAEIRDYGKAWYHHEASELFRVHGRTGDGRGVEGPGFDGTADGFPALPGGLPGGLHRDHGDDPGGMGGVHGGVDRALTGAIRSHVGRFFRRARQFAHELILAGAMALSGPGPLSDAELADVDRAAQEQAEYLQRFEREVIENPPVELQPPMPQFAPIIVSPSPMTMSQFAARAELYGAAAWSAPLDVQRKTFIRHGQAVEERRVHVGSDTPCQMCRDEVAKGWSPIGSLLPIGQCTCLNQCHCHFDYRDSAGKITWSGRGRRKLRLKRLPPAAPAVVPPRPHVQVVPVEPHQVEPPQTIIGPWLDKAGNPVVYHYEEAE